MECPVGYLLYSIRYAHHIYTAVLKSTLFYFFKSFRKIYHLEFRTVTIQPKVRYDELARLY